MNRESRTWLDALTDGQLLRDWTSLNAHVVFAAFEWFVLLSLLALGVALLPVLIGIPLLLFALAGLRRVATFDYQVSLALIDRKGPQIADDVDVRGANLGERLGMYLGSGTTWRSLLYVALKLPVGFFTVGVAWALLPFIALELLILGPLTIDMQLITVRLLHWLAVVSVEGPGLLLPRVRAQAEKSKHDLRVSRLETVYDDDAEPAYVLTDDGEIVRKRMA